jgi:ATP-dependent Zn protease
MVMQGLADYEIIKSGISVVVILYLLCSAVSFLIYSMSKNYQKTEGIINTNTSNQTQTIIYTVDKEYIQIVPFQITNINNVTTSNPVYQTGNCIVYYAKNNPNDYNINTNPVLVLKIASGFLCFLVIIGILWFLFLRSNKGVAGVLGGINAANIVSNSFLNTK